MSRVAVSGLCATLLIACGASSHRTASSSTVGNEPPPSHPVAESAPPPAPEPSPAPPPVDESNPLAPSPPPPPPPAPTAPTVTTIPAQSAAVKVVSKGKGKKSRLAFAFHAGDKRDVVITFNSKIDSSMAKMTMPSFALTMSSEILDVDKNGNAHVMATVTDVSVTDVPNATVKASTVEPQMKKLIGMTTETHVAPDGTYGEETITVPAGAQAGNTQSMQPATVILPHDKIGIGAEWTAVMTIVFNSVKADITTDYHLLSRKNGKAQLSMSMSLSAPKQKLTMASSTADLDQMSGTGTGTLEIDPSSVWIGGATTTSIAMAMSVASQQITMSMTMDMTSTVK